MSCFAPNLPPSLGMREWELTTSIHPFSHRSLFDVIFCHITSSHNIMAKGSHTTLDRLRPANTMVRQLLLLIVLTFMQVSLPMAAFVQHHQPAHHSFGVAGSVPPLTTTFGLASNLSSGTRRAALPTNHHYSCDDTSPIAIRTTPDKPIVVFGAGGKTGRIIAQILAGQKHYVRAVTRTENNNNKNKLDNNRYISYVVGDVRSQESVHSIIQQGAAGVVWAVTSSGVKKGGGDALEVDYKGAYYTAKACLDCNVPKLAFISAACVTRPDALGSKVVNKMTQWTYGEVPWTDAKLAGEVAVRDLYKDREKKRKKGNLAYVIIRPAAALSNKPPIPVNKLVVMQGDVYSSAQSISRTNVANIVVSALEKGRATDFVTFEVAPAVRLYKNDEGNILDLMCLPTSNQKTDLDLPKALVHRNGSSYEELLDGLVTDEDMAKDYGSILNDYRGEGAPSVKEFA